LRHAAISGSPHCPDGRWIAFTAQRAGTYDVYVMPTAGGPDRRLTFIATNASANSEVVGWTPDSRNVVFLSTIRSSSRKIARAFQVPVEGGWPQVLPLDHSGLLSFGPGDQVIAFNRIFRNAALPKRYLGGQHQNLYTYDIRSKRLDRITDWKGTDTAPMWFGRTIYFLSDRGPGFRANIWAYDTVTKSVRQITRFADYDVDGPSLGGHTITFAQGGLLYALDLPSETLRRIDVDVPDDGARTAPRTMPAAMAMRVVDTMHQVDYALSPDGTELAVSAHGDLFALRADRTGRDLTATPGADEDHPSWSPDGGSIAYETDADGEQQIAIRPSGGGPERLLTHFASGVLYTPDWSTDGSRLLVASAAHELWLLSTDGSSPRRLATDPEAEIRDAVFSPDGGGGGGAPPPPPPTGSARSTCSRCRTDATRWSARRWKATACRASPPTGACCSSCRSATSSRWSPIATRKPSSPPSIRTESTRPPSILAIRPRSRRTRPRRRRPVSIPILPA
jgi:tricorn protease